jgi:glutamate formiminotransferase/formiminotetrahydrofolate cyclodeaminase
MDLVECVPNFSEGRRPEVVEAITDAITAVPGVTVLDVSSDASHNRTVVTFVAPPDVVGEAAFQGITKAAELIDLTVHEGEHPRIGATDVCPFVPLGDTTMEQCVELARQLGQRVGDELAIPVFLYERAATRSDRENLVDVRRGEFERASTEIGTNPDRTPDFGPNAIHPSAGATIIGARPFLVAYNVYLGGAENVEVAKAVAKAVRGSSGGLRYVKGLGLEVDGQAQVSMNLVDTDRTPLHRAYDMVRMEAEARGVTPTKSELVGLVPERVLFDAAAHHIRLPGFSTDMVLEQQVRTAMDAAPSLAEFIDGVAGDAPVPGGGSVSALAGQLAAALSQMVAGLTVGRKKYVDVEPEMLELADQARGLSARLSRLVDEDAAAYALVSEAYRLPKDDEDAVAARETAIQQALRQAADVPLQTARACREVAQLAATCAAKGNQNAVTDAGVAALLADAGCRGAAYNVRINVASMTDRSAGEVLSAEVAELVEATRAAASEATSRVEAALS